MSTLSSLEEAKKSAAYRAVDEHFPKNSKVVGIGSGSTVIYAVERIGQRDDVKDVIFVPTGFQSKQLIIENGLRLGCIEEYGVGDLDITFDGADEVDPSLNCIKGGGGCLFQEKLVASCAKKFVLVADYTKQSTALGFKWIQGIPIEVSPLAAKKVESDLFRLGAKSVTWRSGGKSKAGPAVTDNGNFILDTYFGPVEAKDVDALDKAIKLLVGVIETGLFNIADIAYFGGSDGSVTVWNRGTPQ
ncbi:ribose-5-phosphate isomerase [Nadsonia fulvescens var. elongata DSM 6958]|uniref:Ribose-5-phosphate isomerase n=1 Tax=Nadsonia fulvescens var. elongata DSM 6958 TaxID=857566 RepID=A0A1E3PEF2_9ASCO|nr:ribose-5-phosphate isomerase [Nadsonia fulvescens var. elongata DSM 6958]